VLTALLLFVVCLMILGLTACTTIQPSTEIETHIVGRICKEAWLPITLSHHDTELTQAEVKAGNRARKAFCK
jgi:hypothetical protein